MVELKIFIEEESWDALKRAAEGSGYTAQEFAEQAVENLAFSHMQSQQRSTSDAVG